MEKLIPNNQLEEYLSNLLNGKLRFLDFFNFFLTENIYVPSASEIKLDVTGFTPLIFNKNDVKMVAVFTSKSLIKLYYEEFPYCLSITGRDAVKGIKSSSGLVLNPGYDKGLDISPEGLDEIIRDFSLS
jgi:hypothetical protein